MSRHALVLAAGLGTRMRSRLAKVLHPLLGRPLGAWPVAAAREAGLSVVVVVHHQEDAVRRALGGEGVAFARQEAPRGTGDAVRAGLAALPESGQVVVLAGDVPLLRAETLRALLDAHGDRAVTVLAARVADPTGYGRLVRDADGNPLRIVEEAEVSPEERRIDEINTGAWVFDIGWLRRNLPSLRPHPPKGELYLTDLLARRFDEGE